MADYIEYGNCFAYLNSLTDLQAKIAAIDIIINNNIALIGAQTLAQAGSTNMYELDDGQVRIKVIYRSVKEIIEINTALETMKQLYINRLNGRTVQLRDKSTYRGWGYPFGW